MNKIKKKTIFGFSVAEAMVTLLIASIAMAAAAPIFTRRNQVSGNGSRWMITRNGRDISRVSGKVGINVPTNDNPRAFLDIRSSAINTDNLITVSRGGAVIFSMNNLGRVNIDIPTANTTALSVGQSGVTNATINSNGTGQFKIANLFNTAGTQVLNAGTDAIHVNAMINTNGTGQFKTANLFNTAETQVLNAGKDATHVNAMINSNGTGQFKTANLFNTAGTQVLNVGTDATHVNAMINSNGTGQFKTANLFNTAGTQVLNAGTDATHVNAMINTDGVGQFTRTNIFRANGRALQIGTDATHINAWIDADGSSSFGIPQGMIAFFNRPCSNVPGWSDVPEAWQGRYPRIAGTYSVCDVNNANCSTQTLTYNQKYGDAIREITGTVVSLTALGSSITGVFENTGSTGGNLGGGGYYPGDIIRFRASLSVPTAAETRVRTVGLYMCVRN